MKPRTAFLLGIVLLIPAILERDLWAPDEPRHAEVGRTMLVSGDYLVPHLNGEVYPDKPALPFWLVAGSLAATGSTSEWAARLPFALAAAATLALVARISTLLGGSSAALMSVLFLLTAGRYTWLAQRVNLDVLLTFFTTLSILGWLRQQRGMGRDLGNGALFFGGAALAVLTKGPLGLLVPLLTALCHGASTHTLARMRRPGFLAGIPLFLVLVAAWVVPACIAAGPEYTRELLFHQSAGRVSGSWSHRQPFYYYVPKVVLEFLPWSPLLILGLVQMARRRFPAPQDAARFLLAWFVPVLLVLSCISGKRGNYLLPLYPGMAILAALAAATPAPSRGERRALFGSASGLAALLVLLGAGILIAPFLPPVKAMGLVGMWPGALSAGLLLVIGGALGALVLRRGPPRRALAMLAITLCVFIPVAGQLVLPVVDQRKSEQPLALILQQEARTPGQYVPFLDVRPEGYRFYSGLDCREIAEESDFLLALDRPDVTLAVAEGEAYEEIAPRLPPDVEVLAERAVGGEDKVVVLRQNVLEPGAAPAGR
ncbi:MAG: glycosyltransferase family 39 protein [Planctomycetes bacterium]|nr:glycosyltransferase family 39 protein [Planctomycetota bacterium]